MMIMMVSTTIQVKFKLKVFLAEISMKNHV